ncbi:NAD(P)/FAD-dependent oxidoreductase [Desulfosporosinus shakirovi]|uniref:NAD(P)/FAD-dependent oxidoreductase n=1 Tax=Desulfosporosinus shakirovi TaxID=2885154 RepID=UPI001E3326B9|nr:FAD-dependent oxidoreductase [Desulfosporosinus sp. SRJS8]MCB8815970.1 FAD-dependent oxidoreductase [Desulfosporosinus sp. SRJS8]
MIKITGLKVVLTYDLKILEDIVAKRLNIEHSRIERISIVKRTVNARNKQDVHFDMTVVVCVSGDENEVISMNKDKFISKENELNYTVPKDRKLKERPVVIGCGPAGMFAALILAQAGARPILLERGLDVDSRKRKVLKFWRTGILDTQTNVQFGEGGAGAFSDGKLKIGQKNPRKMKVLSELVQAGAPPEIMYLSKPHIGTDRLKETVKGIREQVIRLGGEVRFKATVKEILFKDAKVTGVRFEEEGNITEVSTDNVVLAIGHSARDTFESLLNCGVYMEQKSFAVGVRVEHSQEMIDKIQYGDFAGHPELGAADYKMVVHLQNGRGVYTFCMCPGGTVVAATSEENGLTTNGMSEFARDGRNANTALLVTVEKEEFGSEHPLAGCAFQRRIEAAAFTAGGGGYKAPVQRLEDFLQKRKTTAFGDVLPTYLPGTEFAVLDSFLPEYITDSLRQGILEMGDWMPGFAYPDALLTGAETRSSSPVRITRGESLEAIGFKGLYPCGEGAGYSGGIISAAVDGVLCAEQILGS